MNERVKFVAAAQDVRRTMTELCEQFGVSRKTGYKLLKRYESHGVDGLRDRRHGADRGRALARSLGSDATWRTAREIQDGDSDRR